MYLIFSVNIIYVFNIEPDECFKVSSRGLSAPWTSTSGMFDDGISGPIATKVAQPPPPMLIPRGRRRGARSAPPNPPRAGWDQYICLVQLWLNHLHAHSRSA